ETAERRRARDAGQRLDGTNGIAETAGDALDLRAIERAHRGAVVRLSSAHVHVFDVVDHGRWRWWRRWRIDGCVHLWWRRRRRHTRILFDARRPVQRQLELDARLD